MIFHALLSPACGGGSPGAISPARSWVVAPGAFIFRRLKSLLRVYRLYRQGVLQWDHVLRESGDEPVLINLVDVFPAKAGMSRCALSSWFLPVFPAKTGMSPAPEGPRIISGPLFFYALKLAFSPAALGRRCWPEIH
nr:MAG TPA: hypothetical protein [Caudoviricetes sp.]